MIQSRRQMLGRAMLGLLASTALAGCQIAQPVSTALASLPQWAEDAKVVAGALEKMADGVQSVVGLPSAVSEKIRVRLSQVQSLAATVIEGAKSGSSTAVLAFGSQVAGLVASLTGLQIPAWVSTGLSAVKALMPTILAVAGAVLAPPPGSMPPSAARTYLAGLAAR